MHHHRRTTTNLYELRRKQSAAMQQEDERHFTTPPIGTQWLVPLVDFCSNTVDPDDVQARYELDDIRDLFVILTIKACYDQGDDYACLALCEARSESDWFTGDFFNAEDVVAYNPQEAEGRKILSYELFQEKESQRAREIHQANCAKAVAMEMAGIEVRQMPEEDELTLEHKRSRRRQDMIPILAKDFYLQDSTNLTTESEQQAFKRMRMEAVMSKWVCHRPVSVFGDVLKILQCVMKTTYMCMYRSRHVKHSSQPIVQFYLKGGAGDMASLLSMMLNSQLVHVGETYADETTGRGGGKHVFMASRYEQLCSLFKNSLFPQHVDWLRRVHYHSADGEAFSATVQCRVGKLLGENPAVRVYSKQDANRFCGKYQRRQVPRRRAGGQPRQFEERVVPNPFGNIYKDQLVESSLLELAEGGDGGNDSFERLNSTYSKEKLAFLLEKSRIRSKSFIGFDRDYKVMVKGDGRCEETGGLDTQVSHPFLLRMSPETRSAGDFTRTLWVQFYLCCDHYKFTVPSGEGRGRVTLGKDMGSDVVGPNLSSLSLLDDISDDDLSRAGLKQG